MKNKLIEIMGFEPAPHHLKVWNKACKGWQHNTWDEKDKHTTIFEYWHIEELLYNLNSMRDRWQEHYEIIHAVGVGRDGKEVYEGDILRADTEDGLMLFCLAQAGGMQTMFVIDLKEMVITSELTAEHMARLESVKSEMENIGNILDEENYPDPVKLFLEIHKQQDAHDSSVNCKQ